MYSFNKPLQVLFLKIYYAQMLQSKYSAYCTLIFTVNIFCIMNNYI